MRLGRVRQGSAGANMKGILDRSKLRHGTARSGLPPVWNGLSYLSLTTCYGTDFPLFTGLGKPTYNRENSLKVKKEIIVL